MDRIVILLVGLLSVILSGCVHYDLGLIVHSPNRGEIVQHWEWSDRFSQLSRSSVQEWERLIRQRVKAVGGQVTQASPQDLTVTIPFSQATDLETRFNQFFSPPDSEALESSGVTLPEFHSHLSVTSQNFLLIERYRLLYDFDGRSLGLTSASGDVLVSPGNLVTLGFSIQGPWGVQAIAPSANQQDGRTVWDLAAGEVNQIEAELWVPSPLGGGAIAILGLVVIGPVLQRRFRPGDRALENETDRDPIPAAPLRGEDAPL